MRPSTVLVIDDDASVRRLLVQVLADAGYQVYDAEDGRQRAHWNRHWFQEVFFCRVDY